MKNSIKKMVRFEKTNDEEFEDFSRGLEGLKGLKEINLEISK